MRLLRILAVILTWSVLSVPRSFADPITFTFQGHGAGSINGHPFSDAAFTITGVGDTLNRLVV